jgi:hypothetical protein
MIDEEHSILIENTERCVEWKDLKIDNGSRRPHCCDKEISISPTIYKILEFLNKHILLTGFKIKLYLKG